MSVDSIDNFANNFDAPILYNAIDIEEEIENIFDPDSGHKLAGILPDHPKWKQLKEEALNPNTSRNRKIQILQQIKTAIRKIKNPSAKFVIYSKNKNESEIEKIKCLIEGCQEEIFQKLKISESNPDALLGNGSTAEVYEIMGLNGFCIKIIKHPERYNELDYNNKRIHNRIEEEGGFLEKLEKFKVAGVFTPGPYFYVSAPNFEGLAMETLDAANLSRVFEGHDELPDKFNLDDYFQRLEQYFRALHKEKGIVHRDIAMRNLMVDRITGRPIIIDFGKAKMRQDYFDDKEKFEETTKNGMLLLKTVKQEVKEKLQQLKNNLH